MKHSLVLQQHAPFASMIVKALELSETMLLNSNTLYPFAVSSINNDLQCIFTPESNSDNSDTEVGMIERLQDCITERTLFAESAVSLLVYCATVAVVQDQSENVSKANDKLSQPSPIPEYESDALVFAISDTNGNNNVTIYPYTKIDNRIVLEQPYTCDFSD